MGLLRKLRQSDEWCVTRSISSKMSLSPMLLRRGRELGDGSQRYAVEAGVCRRCRTRHHQGGQHDFCAVQPEARLRASRPLRVEIRLLLRPGHTDSIDDAKLLHHRDHLGHGCLPPPVRVLSAYPHCFSPLLPLTPHHFALNCAAYVRPQPDMRF